MRFIALALVSLVLATSAQAAILIQPGKAYTFGGYLVIGRGPAPAGAEHPLTGEYMRVRLSAFPNGEIPQGIAGRQDLYLEQGTLRDNLFTVARAFGSTKQVLVQGTGNAERGITVSTIEAQAPTNAKAATVSASPLLVARQDALARYAKIHPAVGHPTADGYTPTVKTAYVVEISGNVIVEVDLFGGFGGLWANKAMQFVYAPNGALVVQRAL